MSSLWKERCHTACHVLTGDVSCQCQFVNIFSEWRHTAFNLSLLICWLRVCTRTRTAWKNIFMTKKFINYLLKFESGYHPGIIKERWLSWVQLISDLTHLFWLKYLQLWQLISRNKSKVCTAKHMQIMYCVFIKWKHFESTLCPSQCSWSQMEQIKTKVFKTMPKIVVSS